MRQSDKPKKEQLQKMLRNWMDARQPHDGNHLSKVHVVTVLEKSSMEPTAIAFSSVERNQVCVSELSGEIHLITLSMDGLNCTAAIGLAWESTPFFRLLC